MTNAIPVLSHRLANFYRDRFKGPLARTSIWLTVGLAVAALTLSVALAFVLVRVSPIYAFLPVLALPVGLLLVSRPDIGLLIIIFLIPFEDFNALPGISASSLSVLKLASLAVFGGAIIHFFIFRKLDRLVSAPQNWLILFFLGAVVVSNFVAIDPATTLDKTFKLARVLALYFVAINVIRTRTDMSRVVWVMIVAGLICTLYGIYNYHFNPDTLDINGRISGTMDHPNGYAAAMVARLPLALFLLPSERHPGRRALLAFAVITMLYGVLLSGSRGGMIALVLALVLFIIRQKHKLFYLLLLLTVVLTFLIIAPPHIKERLGLQPTEYNTTDYSQERRLTYQQFGLELFQQNPVAGIGLSGFSTAYARSEYRFMQTDEVKRVAHNMYLEIATGTGILGLIPFLALLAMALYSAFRAAQRAAGQDAFLASTANGVLAGLAGFLVASFFLSEQYEKTLWLLIALTVVVDQLTLQMSRSHVEAESPAHTRERRDLGALHHVP
jgi:putative inorganic carbon (HCO3(-)) transporter